MRRRFGKRKFGRSFKRRIRSRRGGAKRIRIGYRF